MAILRRYAAMFRVGISFIFSCIKSRSASVTLNLICTVLFRPFMRKCSFPFRGFGTLPNKQFCRRCRRAGRAKYGSGYPLPMLAIHLFAFFHDKDGILPNIPAGKEKRCNPQRLQRFLKSVFSCAGRSHLSSFSTSLISFAVAVTIRIPLSLMVSSNVSSCRRCVFFVSGFSKRNWSTDIS
jgi:hypothetical protein